MISDIRLSPLYSPVRRLAMTATLRHEVGLSPTAIDYYGRSDSDKSLQLQLTRSRIPSQPAVLRDEPVRLLRSRSGTYCLTVGSLFTPVGYTPSTRDVSRWLIPL